MNKSELIDALLESDEEEVLIAGSEGRFYEVIEIGHAEEEFDGFDTLYPAAVTLKANEKGGNK